MFIIAYTTPDGDVCAYTQHNPVNAAADVRLIEDDVECYGLGVQTSTVAELMRLAMELGDVPFAHQDTGSYFGWLEGPAQFANFESGQTATFMAYLDREHPAYAVRDEPSCNCSDPNCQV